MGNPIPDSKQPHTQLGKENMYKQENLGMMEN